MTSLQQRKLKSEIILMNTVLRKLINDLGVQKIKVVFHWIAWKNESATLRFQNITQLKILL
jgi:hypothetical protein